MAVEKLSTPRGTRDFGPKEMARRQHIFSVIKNTFELFGFAPLETPSFENLSVLQGKYGSEGDQLIYKILNSGNFLDKVSTHDIEAGYKPLTQKISEKALRYDLTVPFARYVVMNKGQLVFPFKRYQIQPVWRADRPQKGRYREFYQCDADVVGTNSLLCEAEILVMIDTVLKTLGITDYTIYLNNRKILSAIAELAGIKGQEAAMCIAIDKLDKIGIEGVRKELSESGFTNETIAAIEKLLAIDFSIDDFTLLEREIIANHGAEHIGIKGLEEIAAIKEFLRNLGKYDIIAKHLKLDLSLARGLSYYTGTILEVKANNVQMGSISGGGRYDNLTGLFGLEGVSGVGFSFGVDRLYDVMQELNLFSQTDKPSVQVMFAQFGMEYIPQALALISKLRSAGISTELYPEDAKPKKQFSYADDKAIPYVAIIGSNEAEVESVLLKNMVTGQQDLIKQKDLVAHLQEKLT